MAAVEDADPLVGSVINGKFHIIRAIARGGMGRIYYAKQAPLDRPVALKVVDAEGTSVAHQQFLKRFLLEASILAKLQHPNVVTLFDYGRIEGGPAETYFIAMEYLAGETLAQRLKKRAALTAAEVLFLLHQVARGLREAHARDVVHRDLKPSNIILVPEGDGELVKLVDFGIGKVMDAHDVNEDLTQEGMMVGTPRYMAPEQFEGAATKASDIYALGTITYQALAGTLPFQGKTVSEYMVAKFAREIPKLREVNPQAYVPDSLEALVFRMLARAPEERPTIDELFTLLAACEQEVFGTAQSGPSRSGFRRPGSMPSAPPPPSQGEVRSKVPPTIVAPIPHLQHLSTAGQLTPRPISTSMRPERTSGRTAVVVGVALALVGGAGATLWAVKRANSAPVAPTVASAPKGDPEASSPAPNVAPSFTLVVESTPPGASVVESDRVLGTTPFQMPIERASVASTPRTFVVKKEGFLPVTIAQGPSSEPTARQAISLSSEPPTPRTTRPHGSGVVQGPSTRTAEPDIRLKR